MNIKKEKFCDITIYNVKTHSIDNKLGSATLNKRFESQKHNDEKNKGDREFLYED